MSLDRRSRAPLACTACRRKKTKCDRSIPSCWLCAKLDQNCAYPTMRLKPGPKIGYSRTSPHVDGESLNDNRRRSSVSLGKLPTETDADSYSDIQPTSPKMVSNFVKAIGLSSLIHPTHDLCPISVPTGQGGMPSSDSLLNLAGAQDLLMDACHRLGVSLQKFQYLTDLYFETMTEISLFHRPSFTQKIQNIDNSDHLQALFAAMFACSVRFQSTEPFNALGNAHTTPHANNPMWFHRQALELINQSLDKTPDQAPSFCLLQAMVLVTFCELTNGVRGRAWRLLGSCVRVAYELHLHLIDYEAREEPYRVGRDLTRWIADEERRRCWWAIWKMDTFASVTRRCPTGIDWNMIDTYLPVSDEYWFSNQFHQSCFIERDPNDRGLALKNCENHSPDAWLVVITSIMRDAQVLLQGNLHGVLVSVDPNSSKDQLIHYFQNSFCRKITQADHARLKSLIQALHSASTNLPQFLVYREGEILDFGFDSSLGICDHNVRRLQSGKYSIYLALKQAQFMIYHHYAFGEIVSGTIFSPEKNVDLATSSSSPEKDASRGLKYCLQAADDIYSIVSTCPDDHVKHVSPFLASTVWLSASLQILRKLFGKGEDRDDILCKYEALRAACERYTAFWCTPLTLLENLDSLEARLSRYYYSSPESSSSPLSTSLTSTPITTSGPTSLHLELFGRTTSTQSDRFKQRQRQHPRTTQVESLDTISSRQSTSEYSGISDVPWDGHALPDPGLDQWFSQHLSELFSETYQGESMGGARNSEFG